MVNVRGQQRDEGGADVLADFLKRFGVATDTTEIGYAIPPDWQSALSNGSSAGGIIGLLVRSLDTGSQASCS
jgi:hypothetical protein